MDAALEGARQAASQMFEDVEAVKFFDKLPTGEIRFKAVRSGRKDDITITVNPNLINACVEWKHPAKEKCLGYRVFKLEGIVI